MDTVPTNTALSINYDCCNNNGGGSLVVVWWILSLMHNAVIWTISALLKVPQNVMEVGEFCIVKRRVSAQGLTSHPTQYRSFWGSLETGE